MGRVVNIVYGLILLYLAVEALGWLNYFPKELLPYAVLLMGLAIFFTPIARTIATGMPRTGGPMWPQRSIVDFIRRRIFGLALFWIGVASAVSIVGDLTPLLLIETSSGSIILAAIAAIYFLSAFAPTRNVQIRSI
ncbi:hypothetical protein J4422_04575 [Candidatus Pacearchaeota archaeon]|nr:hypothetical protein [Candidatus Pacearchaeota archaeon]